MSLQNYLKKYVDDFKGPNIKKYLNPKPKRVALDIIGFSMAASRITIVKQ